MAAPVEYHKFLRQIKAEGCTVDDSRYPHRIEIYYQGKFVSAFATTHGKRTKRDEVKAPYVRNFQKAIRRIKGGGP